MTSCDWLCQIFEKKKKKKKMEDPNLSQTRENRAQNQVFRHFLKFDSLISFLIA